VVGGLWLPLTHEAPVPTWLGYWLEQPQQRFAGGELHHPSTAMVLGLSTAAVLAAVIGVLIARARYRNGPADATVAPLARRAAAITWAFDRLYQVLVVAPILGVGSLLSGLDRIYGMLAQFTAHTATFIGVGYRTIQFGRLRLSLVCSLMAVVVILLVVVSDSLFRSLP
jgi:hypothetical protein